MTHRSITNVVAVLLAGAFLSTASAAPTLKQQTEKVSAAARAAVVNARAPRDVYIRVKTVEIVDKAVAETPDFACAIIKAAIDGAKLSKEAGPDLIAAALKAAPEKAPEIKACLPAEWAGAAATGETDGSESGADPDGEMNGYRGVVGTYLAAPSGGGSVSPTQTTAPAPAIVRVVTPQVRVVRQQTAAPATPSTP